MIKIVNVQKRFFLALLILLTFSLASIYFVGTSSAFYSNSSAGNQMPGYSPNSYLNSTLKHLSLSIFDFPSGSGGGGGGNSGNSGGSGGSPGAGGTQGSGNSQCDTQGSGSATQFAGEPLPIFCVITTKYNTSSGISSFLSTPTLQSLPSSPTLAVAQFNAQSAPNFLTCPANPAQVPNPVGQFYFYANPGTFIGGDVCLASYSIPLVTTISLATVITPPAIAGVPSPTVVMANVMPLNLQNPGSLNTYEEQYSPLVDGSLSNGYQSFSYIFQGVPSKAQHAIWSWNSEFANLAALLGSSTTTTTTTTSNSTPNNVPANTPSGSACSNQVYSGRTALTFQQVVGCAQQAGFSGVQLETIVAIAYAESSFEPGENVAGVHGQTASGLLQNNNQPGDPYSGSYRNGCSTGASTWANNPVCDMDWGEAYVSNVGHCPGPVQGTHFCYWQTYDDPAVNEYVGTYCKYMPTGYVGEAYTYKGQQYNTCPSGGGQLPWGGGVVPSQPTNTVTTTVQNGVGQTLSATGLSWIDPATGCAYTYDYSETTTLGKVLNGYIPFNVVGVANAIPTNILPFLYYNYSLTLNSTDPISNTNMTGMSEGIFTPWNYPNPSSAEDEFPIDLPSDLFVNYSSSNGGSGGLFGSSGGQHSLGTLSAIGLSITTGVNATPVANYPSTTTSTTIASLCTGIVSRISSLFGQSCSSAPKTTTQPFISTNVLNPISIASTPNNYVYVLYCATQGGCGLTSTSPQFNIAIIRLYPHGYYNATNVPLPFNGGNSPVKCDATNEASCQTQWNSGWQGYWANVITEQNNTAYVVNVISLSGLLGSQSFAYSESFAPYNISADNNGDIFHRRSIQSS